MDSDTKVEKMKLEDHTRAELIDMKEDVDDVYGKGSFKKYVGQDMARLLGFLENNTYGAGKVSEEKKAADVPKNFALVLKGSKFLVEDGID